MMPVAMIPARRYTPCVDGRAGASTSGCPFTESWRGAVLGFGATPRLRPHFFNPRACCVSTAEEPPPDNRREISDGRCCGTHPSAFVARSNATTTTESKRSPPVVNGAGSFYMEAPPILWQDAGGHQWRDHLRPLHPHEAGRHTPPAHDLLQRPGIRHADLRASASGIHTITRRRAARAPCEAPADRRQGTTWDDGCLVEPPSSSRTNANTEFGHRYLSRAQMWSRGTNGMKRMSQTNQIQALLTRNLVRHNDLRARKFLAGCAARLDIRKSGGAKRDELRGPLGLKECFMSLTSFTPDPVTGMRRHIHRLLRSASARKFSTIGG